MITMQHVMKKMLANGKPYSLLMQHTYMQHATVSLDVMWDVQRFNASENDGRVTIITVSLLLFEDMHILSLLTLVNSHLWVRTGLVEDVGMGMARMYDAHARVTVLLALPQVVWQ